MEWINKQNVLIVGLGLMGGSYARALKRIGCHVSAIDRSADTIKYAIENEVIDEGTCSKEDTKDFVKNADCIILALYPNAAIDWIKENRDYENNLDIMKKQIEWGHLCPINPLHLTLYSLDNKNDPLIIDKIPDVYFTSGNKKLNYEKINIYNKEVVLLSLPDFEKTSKFALFNYEDNSVIEIDFSFEF